jgi:hypothetical protein
MIKLYIVYKNNRLKTLGINMLISYFIFITVTPMNTPEKSQTPRALRLQKLKTEKNSLSISSSSLSKSPFSSRHDKKAPTGLSKVFKVSPKPSVKKITNKTLTSVYDKTKEMLDLKEKKNKAIFDKIYTFKPKLNPTSMKMLKIAKESGKDLHHVKKPEKILEIPEESLKCIKKNLSLQEFIDRNYTNELRKYEERKILNYVPKLDKIDDNCTFRPFISTKSKEISKNHEVSLYEISKKKQSEKKLLIEVTKKLKEEEDMKECTFTPRILKETVLRPRSCARSASETRSYSNRSPSTDFSKKYL